MQNTLARVVTGTARFDHITPVLEGLHWLPIKTRVSFKLATLAFKTRQSGEPGYLASLLQPYQPTRELRSSSKDLLVVTTTKTWIGSRAFSHSASTTWNNLPDEVKHCDNLPSFRKNLRTHLFKAAYDHWTDTSASTTSLTTHGALKTLFTYLLTWLGGGWRALLITFDSRSHNLCTVRCEVKKAQRKCMIILYDYLDD